MADRSRYDSFRRYLAPLGLALGIAFLAHQTCRAEENAAVEFSVDLGETAPQVRHLRVDLWDDGTSVGFYDRDVAGPGSLRWQQVVPSPELEATISLTMDDGRVVEVRRKLHAAGGSHVRIDASP